MRTPQQPIGSGFGAATTADEIMKGHDLTGKIAIVTGGYSGIGVETVRGLKAAGARVIVLARDLNRAEAALAEVGDVEIEPMDLMDPVSIDAFAERFLQTGSPLHLLINSAGIMASPLMRDARGYEAQFATNHLGHFQLTTNLLPALRKADGARAVSVSSWGHRRSPVNFEDPNFERREYEAWAAYGQSKTANILFAVELDEQEKGNGVRAFSLHPGSIVETNLGKHLSQDDLKALGVIDAEGKPVLDPSRNMKTVSQGAATSLWCAVSSQLDGMGGVYCENCEVAFPVPEENQENPGSATSGNMLGVMPYAVDAENAARLWHLSEQLLGRSA